MCKHLANLILFLVMGAILGLAMFSSRSDAAYAGMNPYVFIPVLRKSGPPHTSISLEVVTTSLGTDTVTDIATPPGDDRIFLTYGEGIIEIIQNDAILPSPFLDISDEVSTFNWEEGLLGLTFHPHYAENGTFFVAYTAAQTKNIIIARYYVNPTNPDLADAGSRQILMSIPKPLEANGLPSPVHNGGDLNFGPDGYLYISTGDGGPNPYQGSGIPGDPYNNAQRRDVLLGKILRIDVDGTSPLPPDCGQAGYAIPADNPFTDHPAYPGECDEIWASGLRNPWRFSIDSVTGDIYIGDVGEWQREEINYLPAGVGGLNFGWHCYEGELDYGLQYPVINCSEANVYTMPLVSYAHYPNRCAVIGGAVYRGSTFTTLYGQYLYADFCSGQIWRYATVDPVGEIVEIGDFPVYWTVIAPGPDGELYASGFFIDGQTGPPTLFRLIVP